jgi:hypothetical protein
MKMKMVRKKKVSMIMKKRTVKAKKNKLIMKGYRNMDM